MAHRQYRDQLAVIAIECHVAVGAKGNLPLPEFWRQIFDRPSTLWMSGKRSDALPNGTNGSPGRITIFWSEKGV